MITNIPLRRVFDIADRIETATGQPRLFARQSPRLFYAAGESWQVYATRDKRTGLWRVSIDK